MENLDQVIQQLEALDSDFYGRVLIKVRDGKAVMITEERDTRLDTPETERGSRAHSH
jgi:hypothetical protein